ncbi:hypothetical protein FIBSPDRAFT_822728 [Athelia psychrophila]|uniref:Uncharacterized protein n=1 Tax=Athelia psychrophila TaxID=1759441 RepID=A0A166MGE7_9AGAM|nr:hypothetical protein FIBSPDRAFT_822728 [Fibularhizoctonia sp. CBS 109695]
MSDKIDGQEECPETGTRETLCPARSSYVTIKLDPLGSVAFTEDDEAATAAENLSVKTYVGFVESNRDNGQTPFQSFEVRMLRPGLPPACPAEFFTADMCIPVFPNADHPSRAPLQPAPAIPWTNAYHVASEKVILRVRAALADETRATALSKPERLRLALACALDYERQSDSICAASICAASAGASPASSGSVSSGAEEDSVVWEVTQDPPDTTPWVHMSYDLAGVQELCDPQDFFREIEVVYQ